jgi:hypothetical protein
VSVDVPKDELLECFFESELAGFVGEELGEFNPPEL